MKLKEAWPWAAAAIIGGALGVLDSRPKASQAPFKTTPAAVSVLESEPSAEFLELSDPKSSAEGAVRCEDLETRYSKEVFAILKYALFYAQTEGKEAHFYDELYTFLQQWGLGPSDLLKEEISEIFEGDFSYLFSFWVQLEDAHFNVVHPEAYAFLNMKFLITLDEFLQEGEEATFSVPCDHIDDTKAREVERLVLKISPIADYLINREVYHQELIDFFSRQESFHSQSAGIKIDSAVMIRIIEEIESMTEEEPIDVINVDHEKIGEFNLLVIMQEAGFNKSSPKAHRAIESMYGLAHKKPEEIFN